MTSKERRPTLALWIGKERSAIPDCYVYAYDVFGNQIGDGKYLLDPISGGEAVTRSVKVTVDEAVASYSVTCAEA